MPYGKIRYQLPMAEYTFSDCHLSFSLVKAAMNATRLCKLRKDYPTGIGNGAMVLTKRLHFFIFQLPKAEERPLHTLQTAEGLSF
jgi:hypothetical protein